MVPLEGEYFEITGNTFCLALNISCTSIVHFLMIRSKLQMEDKLFKSLRSKLTKLLLVFDMWGEIEIWQKGKVVASSPRTAKCPRQNTTSCTMGASRAHTAHSLQNICVRHPIRERDKKRPFSTTRITRSR